MMRPALSLLIVLGGTLMAVEPPTADTVLATLNKEHPRILLGDARLAELKHLVASDALAKKCLDDVLAEADKLLEAPALQHKLIGPRLLSVSRDCLKRTLTLGLAWRMTGKDAYLRAAAGNLLTVCAFADWNPSHFLDVAEMSNAVGIGYDWLYAGLGAEQRETIRAGLIKHGLEEGIKASGGWDGSGKKAFWYAVAMNWNQVCHGGLTVGSLAVADTDPKYAQALVVQALAEMPKALAGYEPDGAWPEGPGYWTYATDYTVFALAAMESALGTDFGLGKRQGLGNAGFFPTMARSPIGLMPNFADVGDRSKFAGSPLLFWLGAHYQRAGFAEFERAALAGDKQAAALDLVWFAPASAAIAADKSALPLDHKFAGEVPLAIFRSAWNDPDALYAYLKGGFNAVNHGHLDLGSFEFDALGERWARDLGSDDYNMPGYFSGGAKGPRWQYYRLNSHSHSVPLIEGKDQLVSGKAVISKFLSSDAEASAVVELSSAYQGHATSARRGLRLVDHRRGLLVQDEFVFEKSSQLTWAMTTDATIEIKDGGAVLSLGGKQVRATILSPAGATFSQESGEQQPPQKANKGVQRLLITLAEQNGAVRIAVLFAPHWADGKDLVAPALTPLAEW